MEEKQELIVLLSTFNTNEKGGDGSSNPNVKHMILSGFIIV